MRLLFIVQKFRQGWGGAPESVRLMANQILADGIDADVYDDGTLLADVGQLALLPEPGAARPAFDPATLGRYDAIVQTGPWQRPAGAIKALIAKREARQKLFYLPRGGLGRAEFARLRDFKKLPYLALVERGFIRSADGIVLSSAIEGANTVAPARRRRAEHVIPDFVNPLMAPAKTRGEGGPVTFAFLAEISPRKGLLPLVEGFISWVKRDHIGDQARLIVGGAPRPGSEAYLAQVRALCAVAPDAKIELRGAIPHGARGDFYGDSDVMVVSSSFESYGLTVIEALVQGCDLLSTPNIGALEVLPEGLPVTVAKGADAAALSEALAASYAAVRNRSEADREATRIAADAMVLAINRTARERWAALLRD